MKELSKIIGSNLNKIRKEKGLSLDKVSQLTGVSKAMLGQIERGESNPTVTTLWKMSTGLTVSFSAFMEESIDDLLLINMKEIESIEEDNGKMKLYPLFKFDVKRGFEIFTIELQSGCFHESNPHNEGLEEYVIVTEGALDIIIDEEKFVLNKGDAIRFKGSKRHIYTNPYGVLAAFQNIIYYF